MNVLVTGAAGFIGSHLCERLLERGDTVVGVDNLETGRVDNVPDGVGLHREDIADRDVLYGIANATQPDLIVHCAASYSNPDYWHRDTNTNTTGSINVALAAKHHGSRVVYFQTALPPTSSYAISKHAGEHYLSLSGVPLTTFRLANMYGPRNLSGPIPTFFRRISAGEPCTVVNTRRDMVYVGDLVDGVMAALERGVTGRFDMCSGQHRPISDLYAAVAGELGCDEKARQVDAGADDVKEMELDEWPARRDFGWSASTALEDGVAAAVGWYRAHGVTDTYTHLRVKG